MLILVGVTVTTAINGKLFESARKATIGTSFEKDKEQLTAAIAATYNKETGEINKENLKATLGHGWSVDGNGPYTVTSPNKNIYNVEINGTITDNKETSEIKFADMYCEIEECTNDEHLHKGDYVDYKPTQVKTPYKPDGDTPGSRTGEDTEIPILQESLNWRVLGKDASGNVLLISGSPTNAYLAFSGYIGYNNYEDVLNDTCKALYSNTSLGATARSITAEDIETYLEGDNFKKEEYDNYGYKKTINSRFYFDYDKTKGINRLTRVSEDISDNTTTEVPLTCNAYSYELTKELIGEKNREILLGKNEENLFMMFVASRSVEISNDGITSNDGIAWWCIGHIADGFYSCNAALQQSNSWAGYGDGSMLYYRPVICIPKNVKSQEIHKLNGTIIETWPNSQ